MLLEDYFDRVGSHTIRFRGRRLGIEDVLELYLEGYQAEQIALEFPELTLEEVYAAITYYWRNQDELDRYLTDLNRIVEASISASAAQAPPPVVQRLRDRQKTSPLQQPIP